MKYGYLSLIQVGQVHIIAKRVCSEKENCFKVKDIVLENSWVLGPGIHLNYLLWMAIRIEAVVFSYIVVINLNARILDNLWNSVQVQKKVLKNFALIFLEFFSA